MRRTSADTIINKAAAKMIKEYTMDQGLTMADLATKGAIPAPALSHIKHYKRKLTPELGSRLARAMEMTSASFYTQLLHLALSLQEEEHEEDSDVFFAGDSYMDGITRNLMGGLGKEDIYWLIAIEKPIEFSSLSLDETLINCISNGSYIRYVFPLVRHDDLLDDVFGDYEGASDILAEHGSEHLDKHFHHWRNRFIRRHPVHTENIRKYIECYQVPLEGNVWFAPFVKYILIERCQSEYVVPDEAWLDVAYYDGKLDETPVISPKRCALPLNPMVVHNLKRWCSNSASLVQKI